MKYNQEQLIEALGIGSLDDDVQEQVLANFLSAVELRSGQEVADKLTSEQLDEFTALVDKDGDTAGENWLREHVEGFDDIEDQVVDQLIAEADNMNLKS